MILVPILLGASWFAFKGGRTLWRRHDLEGRFGGKVSEYKTYATLSPAARRKRHFVRGRVLPVDMSDSEVHSLYYDLPEEMRPAQPSDVESVALIEVSEEPVGEYNTHAKAFMQTVTVRVVDMATKTVVGDFSVDGEAPPDVIRGGASRGTGYVPTVEIVRSLMVYSDLSSVHCRVAQEIKKIAGATPDVIQREQSLCEHLSE